MLRYFSSICLCICYLPKLCIFVSVILLVFVSVFLLEVVSVFVSEFVSLCVSAISQSYAHILQRSFVAPRLIFLTQRTLLDICIMLCLYLYSISISTSISFGISTFQFFQQNQYFIGICNFFCPFPEQRLIDSNFSIVSARPLYVVETDGLRLFQFGVCMFGVWSMFGVCPFVDGSIGETTTFYLLLVLGRNAILNIFPGKINRSSGFSCC